GGLLLAGVMFANQDATYNWLYDKSNRGAILMGGTGDSTNIHRNANHLFQGAAGGGYSFLIDASGITLTNGIAYRSRNASGTIVNLIYIGSDNYVRIGENGANFITPDGTFYHQGNLVIPNGAYYY